MQPIQVYQFLVLILTLTVTSVVSLQCVKAFYDQDNYYKIYCFKESEGISSIKLSNNITIEKVKSTNNEECFKIIKPQQIIHEITCIQRLEESCLGDNEVHPTKWTEESNITTCKKISYENELYRGIRNGNLTVIFEEEVFRRRCMIIYVPNIQPKRE
ncbi:uncharacterized protein LOC114349488 isoform X2 [Diabrotica virgifera virgifera]|uniref:Uncharacterized protein LOC114349488 isoform X2 n=1 Tax=Diabrotica virgifera virgifera TaxID=50390 RepID=A0A6P7H2J0_DIAVI|nr:uncharacterized protein LOC114349488 isoform X2 [Diabrotica virgifera virgifera]